MVKQRLHIMKKSSGLDFDIQKSMILKKFNFFFFVIDCFPKMGRNSINMCPMTMKLIFLDSLANFASNTTCLETLYEPEGKTYLGVLESGTP